MVRERDALRGELAQHAEHGVDRHRGRERRERVLTGGVGGQDAQRGAQEAVAQRLGEPDEQLGGPPRGQDAARARGPFEMCGRRVGQPAEEPLGQRLEGDRPTVGRTLCG
jgi:hypothetical protein